MDAINWILAQHRDTNHMYDGYIPYEFHLRMAQKIGEDFKHLIDDLSLRRACLLAIWGHDLIEDARTSYNDVKVVLGQEVADIIYAVTNEKGKSRSERANDKYYEGIRSTEGAVFVKLCDRIANVLYSKVVKRGRMFDTYCEENDSFMTRLGFVSNGEHPLNEMFQYLSNILKNENAI